MGVALQWTPCIRLALFNETPSTSFIKTFIFVKLEENTPIGQGQVSFVSRTGDLLFPGSD